MYLYALLADVASKEQQQQSTEDSRRDQEEEVEDTFLDTEKEEELRAADIEQLKPEKVKSGTTPGESCSERIPSELSDLEKSLLVFCSLIWFVFPYPKPWPRYLFAYDNFTIFHFRVKR